MGKIMREGVRMREDLEGTALTELSAQVGTTVVSLSVLKNGRARAIRLSTLSRICEVLRCQPGDLITHDFAEPTQSRPL
ncbi:helix-turn-helix domain-containing protein [Streptomyces sp. NPDC017673]|uniref:helix-turn-helix domain-containing protein n=1 Tax=unclassified Streptomyces TaxID=2593676 RepID=UPI0037B9A3A0